MLKKRQVNQPKNSPLILDLLVSLADGLTSTNDTDALFPEYADRPIDFIYEVLQVEHLTDEQKAIVNSVVNNPETNVQAGHGVGKTKLSALLAIWWVLAKGGLCVTSAPTSRQVKELLWSEIRRTLDKVHSTIVKLTKTWERGQLFFKVTETARAYGFTSFSYSSDTFQGIHESDLLIILDEANGITKEVWDGATSCLTGSSNRMLTIGNPTVAGTPFEKACQESHLRISVWNHPNIAWAYELHSDGIHRLKADVAAAVLNDKGQVLSDNRITDECYKLKPKEIIPGAISVSWIERIRKKYREKSAFWMSRVEALFPTDHQNSIVPRSWFMAARARYDIDPKYWDTIAATYRSSFGLDVGDGVDPHALARWQWRVLYSIKVQATLGDRLDVPRAATWAAQSLEKYPGSINVDRTGVGAGTLGNLIEAGFEAYGIHWGSSVAKQESQKDDNEDSDEPIFVNRKAQDFWRLREAFRTGTIAIAPLDTDDEENEEMLAEELASIHYEETAKGEIKIEDKRTKTIPRLGRSPNVADAACLGYAEEEDEYYDNLIVNFGLPTYQEVVKAEARVQQQTRALVIEQQVISQTPVAEDASFGWETRSNDASFSSPANNKQNDLHQSLSSSSGHLTF